MSTGPVLWGPYTLTLSTIAPVVNSWQTSALTATSTRLVARLRCSSAKRASVRVSLYSAAFTKLATGSAVSCDGATHTRSLTARKGTTYYVSFVLDGTSAPVTATVSAG